MMLEIAEAELEEDPRNKPPYLRDWLSHLDPYPTRLMKNPEPPILGTLEKQHDPGALTLPCSVADLHFPKCLVDTGASISVMPLSIAARIGFRDFPKKGTALRLADQSKAETYGFLPSIPVVIEGVEVLTDFIVVKMTEEPSYGLLLGRSFLKTTSADLDIMTGTTTLNLGPTNRTIFTKHGSVLKMSPAREDLQSDSSAWSSAEEADQVWDPEIEWSPIRSPPPA